MKASSIAPAPKFQGVHVQLREKGQLARLEITDGDTITISRERRMLKEQVKTVAASQAQIAESKHLFDLWKSYMPSKAMHDEFARLRGNIFAQIQTSALPHANAQVVANSLLANLDHQANQARIEHYTAFIRDRISPGLLKLLSELPVDAKTRRALDKLATGLEEFPSEHKIRPSRIRPGEQAFPFFLTAWERLKSY